MRQERWETLVREGLGLQAGAGKYLGPQGAFPLLMENSVGI